MGEVHSSEYQWMLIRLRKARAEAGLTQEIASKMIGKPQSYISKCESGERRIDPIELAELAKLYKKNITYFLKG